MTNFNKLDSDGNVIETIFLENTVDKNNGIEFEAHGLIELSNDNDFNWQMVNGTGRTSNQVKLNSNKNITHI